ncbi:hypothetical protein PMG71_18935 [Roseofilum sp. BLCC_M154]|uniref:Uncharacterized protein n=1 Tax=Roseofilum acuticapitatum BLCC-M154 TaxID=3022444 RepID=A0ABT7AX71_9CYAN|nr:hypothetical protein [Roseofilum acuticapitatum]MDJ1171510.1 hypothetical protein [Roseofilum acuticapitatum BLCC-M154]
MSLYETMDEFRIKINQLVEQIEEVSSSSQTLPSTDFDQLGHKFAGLMENLEEAHGQMRMATELLEEMINTL